MKTNCKTPCLCDTCLSARDKEICLVRAAAKREVLSDVNSCLIEDGFVVEYLIEPEDWKKIKQKHLTPTKGEND